MRTWETHQKQGLIFWFVIIAMEEHTMLTLFQLLFLFCSLSIGTYLVESSNFRNDRYSKGHLVMLNTHLMFEAPLQHPHLQHPPKNCSYPLLIPQSNRFSIGIAKMFLKIFPCDIDCAHTM